MKKFDIIVVGGGPVGLNAIIKSGSLGYTSLLLEQGDSFGGQITNLYPEKPIEDLRDIKSIKAQDYIDLLLRKITTFPNITLQSNTEVQTFKKENDLIEVITSSGIFVCRYLILAMGLGTYQPRKLNLAHEDDYPNILYSLKDPTLLKGQDVVVLGGGDSAIDWTKALSKIARSVKIIHRRNEFRGDVTPLLNLTNVTIMTPYNVVSLSGSTKLTSIVLENVENKEQQEIALDSLLVNYGSIPVKSTILPIEYDHNFVKVIDRFKTNVPNVFCVGDLNTYEGKKRRIEPGIEEIEELFSFISHH